jgi:putative sigma-54 modulation protein
MRFTIYGKNMHISEDLKDIFEKKFSKFDRFFAPDTEVYATFSKLKEQQILEVTIPINGTILRAEESSNNMVTSIERVVTKLEGQLRKHRTRLEKRNTGESIRFDELEDESMEIDEENLPKLVRSKKFAIKPMTVEEAALQMDLLGHNFFVFLNGETEEVNVVYKRKDNNFGWIEPTL